MYKSIDRFVNNFRKPSQMFVNYRDIVIDDYHRQKINIWWSGKSRRDYRLNHFRRLYGYSGEANHWIYVHLTNTVASNRFSYMSFENDGILVVDVLRDIGQRSVHYDFIGSGDFIPANKITSLNVSNASLGKQYVLTFDGHKRKFKIQNGYFADPDKTFTQDDTLTEGLVKQIHHYINNDYPADTYQKRIKIKDRAVEECVTRLVTDDCVSHPKNPVDSFRHFWTFRVCDIDSRTGLLWDTVITLVLSGALASVQFISWGWTLAFIACLYYLLFLEVIRRLHDVGWHWLVALAMAIPGVNIILLLILLFKPSVHTSSDEVKKIIATIDKK